MTNKVIDSKRYYKWSILIIIPLVGFIIGIILLRKGVILKDRLLIYVGLAGIFFTIVFYGWIIYYGRYSQPGKAQAVEFTKFQLNRTMQEVEIYKLANGNYPDNLQELKSQDKHVPIIDPLSQHFLSKKFTYFNYKKIGDSNYTLFSSGLDQTPNTSDDIYPNLSAFRSKKFGLLKNNK